MSKKLSTESGCPCRDDVTVEECEDCQDLPRGYFENRRKERINFLWEQMMCKCL